MSLQQARHVETAASNPLAAPPRHEIDEWILASVRGRVIEPTAEVVAVHQMPWSTVLALTGATTRLYFKAVWAPQRHEVQATALLACQTPRHIPSVVAVDEARGWMLLADAGDPLKSRDAEIQVALLPDALRRYAEVQVASMPHVGNLLAAGVPDRRQLRADLHRLLAGYPTGREDSLTEAELEELRAVVGRVESMERHLAALTPTAVEHGDLHPGNIAVDAEDQARVFDWGDVSIASPFLSLAVLLANVEESLGLVRGAASHHEIVAAYLEPFGVPDDVNDIAALVYDSCVLGTISQAVTWDHIATHVSPEDRAAFPDPVASSLRNCLRVVTV